ncbi:MAG: type IX secretion system membrane protein PorP/SprF [bacterium]|nr:type IX secretion system membrane protein PorP/SprF [bacterium]
MKGICTALFILSGFFTFAQLETVPHQFWNNFSHFNPSLAGLTDQQRGGLMYQGNWGNQHSYFGFYNLALKNNPGTGVNMNHSLGFNSQTSEVSVPISYDWNFKGRHHIAFGVAPSFRNSVSTGLIYDTTQTGTIYTTGVDSPASRNHLQSHAGVTYKHGPLHLGAGVRNVPIASAGDVGTEPWKPHYYGHFTVDLSVGSKSSSETKHTLALSALYTYVDGFNRVDLNARAQWENGLNVFLGSRVREGWTVGAGWDIRQKLRCLYSVSWSRSKLSNGSNVQHGISLVYHVSKR